LPCSYDDADLVDSALLNVPQIIGTVSSGEVVVDWVAQAIYDNGDSDTNPEFVFRASSQSDAEDSNGRIKVLGESCIDDDGDGWGSPGNPLCPEGDELDCDDTDGGINPGADEICWNGVDENCDGEIDNPDDICSPYNVDQSQDGITIADLIEVARDYHYPPGTYSGLDTDVNDDSHVNILDIILVSANMG